MPTQISNQATLTYQYGQSMGTASSNIATATLQGPLTVTKNSLFTDYREGEDLTYILTFTNASSAAMTNVSVVDNLATYTTDDSVEVTPLTYTGPAYLYINGVFSAELTPDVDDDSVTFTVPALAAGANAMILYKATVNEYALLEMGSELTNTTVFRAEGITETASAEHTIPVEEYADIRIIKTMSPSVITDGNVMTYTFTLYNYGNTEATDVVLSDAFSPVPTNITVTVNGTPVNATDYTYINGVLTLPGEGAELTLSVPAATFTQDEETGAVTVSPGITTIVVTGTI